MFIDWPHVETDRAAWEEWRMAESLIEDYDAIAQRLRELEREKAPKQETPIVLDSNPPEHSEVDPWGFFGDGCC